MGIDRIGKGGAPPAPDAGAALPKAPGGGAFEVARAEAPAVDATAPLVRLRAGEIDLDGYVDLKVAEATRGLDGLSAEALAEIRRMLRDQMATDPALQDLVRAATGRVLPEE